ncbi:TPA: YiiD C-terminal domain-containing protein [Mannheimia haemolytica]
MAKIEPHFLQEWLHQHIPATALLDLRLTQANTQAVCLTANFAKNHNHHGTAFGGSIALLATACGWLSAYLQFDGNPNIVIKRSSMDYLAPAVGDLRAECLPLVAETIAKSQKMLARFGKGTVTIDCRLFSGAKLVAVWQGEFAIFQAK